ncbi:hypothetical protein UT300003_02780 [Clostridium sardiniense]|uniref:response regulator n=1 Tax=Clostridium sardiniense TaxID=29369 RepID=UPI00195E4CA1|nr:response regulator [Clostridium sardiniense]MBM7833540.1 DNA-binding response OmpR family regulator [Clostridium sardiniense]
MKKILIVDDEKNIRIGIKHCLKSEGYNISMACDGEEALHKAENENYDLILMDYQMPNRNGVEILKILRENNILTKVIIMTAYGTVDVAVEAMKLGAVDFISKPFTLDKLKECVKDNMNKDNSIIRVEENSEYYIGVAKEAILKGDFEEARYYLKEALVTDTSNAIIQNLFGVIEEKLHNKSLAQKYYRAALSLDATYKPADNNLRRTVMYGYTTKGIDLG